MVFRAVPTACVMLVPPAVEEVSIMTTCWVGILAAEAHPFRSKQPLAALGDFTVIGGMGSCTISTG